MPDELQVALWVIGIVLLCLAGLMLLYSGLLRPIVRDVSERDISKGLQDWLQWLLDLRATVKDTLGAAAIAALIVVALLPLWPLGAVLFGAGAFGLVTARMIVAYRGKSITKVLRGEISPNLPGSIVIGLAVAGSLLVVNLF